MAKALATDTSLDTMQKLDLVIVAAEEMEAKLSLADRQANPTLAALNADEGRSAPRGGNRAARQHRDNQKRGHPYSGGRCRGRHIGNNPANGRGYNTSWRVVVTSTGVVVTPTRIVVASARVVITSARAKTSAIGRVVAYVATATPKVLCKHSAGNCCHYPSITAITLFCH